METNTIILSWMILGLINLGLLYWWQKKRPDLMYEHVSKGVMYQAGVMILWFFFAFIIVPYIVLATLRKILLVRLVRMNLALNKLLERMKR